MQQGGQHQGGQTKTDQGSGDGTRVGGAQPGQRS
jgi:hypothetical protein